MGLARIDEGNLWHIAARCHRRMALCRTVPSGHPPHQPLPSALHHHTQQPLDGHAEEDEGRETLGMKTRYHSHVPLFNPPPYPLPFPPLERKILKLAK